MNSDSHPWWFHDLQYLITIISQVETICQLLITIIAQGHIFSADISWTHVQSMTEMNYYICGLIYLSMPTLLGQLSEVIAVGGICSTENYGVWLLI